MAGYGDSRSTSSRDALAAIAMRFIDDNLSLFAASARFPPYLFLSREDDDEVRGIGKPDVRSVLLHPMLSNANPILVAQTNPQKIQFYPYASFFFFCGNK